ncbi:MAG TPA: hypothetical protein VK815_09350 [Candidatus Acidoferrales bacterium]|nr:hypothetical protein [Candidatus Acidoferrales bacterium]
MKTLIIILGIVVIGILLQKVFPSSRNGDGGDGGGDFGIDGGDGGGDGGD